MPGFKLWDVVLSFKLLQEEGRYIYECFQHGDTRIAEIVRSICWIDTQAVTQQFHTDKIRFVKCNIYVHVHVSVVFAAIIMVFYKNID
jgi:hypothetical protein